MKQNAMSKRLPVDFPKTAADWEQVIASAHGERREPTVEETEQMQRSVVVYSGGSLAVREALTKRRRGLGKNRQATSHTAYRARHLSSLESQRTRLANAHCQVLAEHAPSP